MGGSLCVRTIDINTKGGEVCGHVAKNLAVIQIPHSPMLTLFPYYIFAIIKGHFQIIEWFPSLLPCDF
jgi:hypothetical protein